MGQDLVKRIERISTELSYITECIESTIKERDAGVLVSCTEAARLLDVTPKTVSMMIRDGRLKKITIGESTGIRLSEIWEIKTS